MKLGTQCEECKTFIEKGKTGYHRKNRFDEIFCSIECLEKHVIDNLEIRTKEINDDEEDDNWEMHHSGETYILPPRRIIRF